MMRIFIILLLVLFPFILDAQNILYTMPAEYDPLNLHATAVEEQNTNKQLLQIVDVLGRKVKEDSKQLLFYIFENGSVEKKIQIID